MGARTAALALGMSLLAGCTFALSAQGTTWGCGPFRYEVNPSGAGQEQVEAVHSAVARYVAATGREAVFVGPTDDRHSDGTRPVDAPVLFEWFWPDDEGQRHGFGYAEAMVESGHYVGGFVYLHPSLAAAAADLVERVALHELGHIGGLDHVHAEDELMNPDLVVDDWGAGDLVGLSLTHADCGAGK